MSVPTELEQTQDRLRAAEVVIMALYHRIESLEARIKAVSPFGPMSIIDQRELKYDSEGLRLVAKDVKNGSE